jgi:hypothetical protein
MPRVGLQLADDLHKLSEELGHPGIEPLWIAVKRRKLAAPKKQVTEYVRAKAEAGFRSTAADRGEVGFGG